MSSFVQLVLRAGGGWGRSGSDSAGRGVQGADPGSGRRWPWNDGQHLCQVLVKSGNLNILSATLFRKTLLLASGVTQGCKQLNLHPRFIHQGGLQLQLLLLKCSNGSLVAVDLLTKLMG